MKWASAVSQLEKTADALDAVVDDVRSGLDGAVADLLLLFVSSEHLAGAADIARTLAQRFPTAELLGCTAQSVIGAGREIEDGPGIALAAAQLPDVSVRAFRLAPEQIAERGAAAWRGFVGLPEGEAPSFLLLGDPFSCDSEAVIRGLESAYPGSVQVGGLASGARQPAGNGLYLGDRVLNAGLVAVGITGNAVLDTIVAQGCRPIGDPMFVTRCHENILSEVDGRRPMDVLNELFSGADPRERRLFQDSLFLGIQMHDEKMELGRGDFLVRNLLSVDPDAGTFAVGALLEETQVVQFHLRDGRTADEDLDERLAPYGKSHRDAEGAVLFSCLGRGRNMYGTPNHDSDALGRHLGDIPVAGFFCNGEIGPVEGRTFLHSYTSAFGIFRPRR